MCCARRRNYFLSREQKKVGRSLATCARNRPSMDIHDIVHDVRWRREIEVGTWTSCVRKKMKRPSKFFALAVAIWFLVEHSSFPPIHNWTGASVLTALHGKNGQGNTPFSYEYLNWLFQRDGRERLCLLYSMREEEIYCAERKLQYKDQVCHYVNPPTVLLVCVRAKISPARNCSSRTREDIVVFIFGLCLASSFKPWCTQGPTEERPISALVQSPMGRGNEGSKEGKSCCESGSNNSLAFSFRRSLRFVSMGFFPSDDIVFQNLPNSHENHVCGTSN